MIVMESGLKQRVCITCEVSPSQTRDNTSKTQKILKLYHASAINIYSIIWLSGWRGTLCPLIEPNVIPNFFILKIDHSERWKWQNDMKWEKTI